MFGRWEAVVLGCLGQILSLGDEAVTVIPKV